MTPITENEFAEMIDECMRAAIKTALLEVYYDAAKEILRAQCKPTIELVLKGLREKN